MSKVSIMIVDDHKLIRETWSFILGSDPRFEVIAECGDPEEAIEMAKMRQPHIVLMDINMSPISGFDATEQIRRFSPETKVIGVSMHSQPAYARKMLQVGAQGYVTKNSSKDEMVKAILEVDKGNKYICDEIRHIISGQLNDAENEGPDIQSLTEREIQIIHFIKAGNSSKEIAQQLDISLKTVEVHRHNILKKLKLKNAAALVNFINSNPSLY
ncbi:response regulator [Flavihumibacter petaseus]|uniref:Putative two-component response regulator n=1 Tax=Flavihumibacter petaseus NBRC 106054 TaxID=1220578 RepID=A0A0E9N0A5_9BACT|nr:response regulator transcription factor [Flavihumibacter petaseus]GAO42800.1 putative two-component response regulator [Flavihumibacter petaseus NBRC 106054]